MTGEDLYLLWVEAMEVQGIEVDGWEHVAEAEQLAWTATAALVVAV